MTTTKFLGRATAVWFVVASVVVISIIPAAAISKEAFLVVALALMCWIILAAAGIILWLGYVFWTME